MKIYLLSLFGASLATALIHLLAPEGTQGGVSKYLKLLCSLFLLAVIVSPLPHALREIRSLPDRIPDLGGTKSGGLPESVQEALDESSKIAFARSLTQLLEHRFSIPAGEIRCVIRWEEREDDTLPEEITLLLSGSAIWQDPDELEAFVTSLVHCTCKTALERRG